MSSENQNRQSKTAVTPYQPYPYQPVNQPPPYQPTATQLEREAATRRFNLLYVYLPLGFFTAVALIVTIALFVGAYTTDSGSRREFISAVADIVVILMTIPLILLITILPAGAIAFYFNRRQQPAQAHSKPRILFWRLDTLVNKTSDKTSDLLPKLAAPFIWAQSQAVYLVAFLNNIKNTLTRS